MASAAEQMASNMSWSAFGKATELKQRILFHPGTARPLPDRHLHPVPGIDGAALREFMEGAGAGLGGILSMFTGGALGRMGIFALGIMPYISASIIIQLIAASYEPWKNLKKEGQQGRIRLNQYTRYFTVVLATIQAYGMAVGLRAAASCTTRACSSGRPRSSPLWAAPCS
jgi:preprotein translocase subunit SecY